jgi:hypothetical protein
MEQLSAAVGAVQVTTALHEVALAETLMLAGQKNITGARLSFNVMVNEQELALPAASVAVSVTSCVVLCPLSTVPATGDCVSVAPQLSVTVAV